MKNEQDYQRYQEYMAYKANRISGDLGNVALSTFTLGLGEIPVAAEPYGLKESQEALPAYRSPVLELGSLSLRQELLKQRVATPNEAIKHLSREAFDLAA